MSEIVAAYTSQPAGEGKSSLHTRVLEELRNYINEGRLRMGARVPERELCELLNISRTPLREALKVLASEGIIELLPNRGARLRTLLDKDIIETFEVIGGLEALAGKLACERITQEEVDVIENLHVNMYRQFLCSDLAAYFKLNQEIHLTIVAAAQNDVLKNTYLSLSSSMRRFRYAANLDISRDRWGAAMREHEAILEALKRRAGSELGELLLQHIRNTFTSALKWLAEERQRSEAAES